MKVKRRRNERKKKDFVTKKTRVGIVQKPKSIKAGKSDRT